MQVDVLGLAHDGVSPPTHANGTPRPARESPRDARRREVRQRDSLDSDGLTPTQRTEYDRLRQQDEWTARRYRYEQSKANYGETDVMPEDAWRRQAEQNHLNQREGAVREARGRQGASDHLGRDLDNSNSAGNVVQEGGTRPDSVGRNADGQIDVVHDHKHLGGQQEVVYDSDQFRAQRDLIEDPSGPGHVVTCSSSNPNLSGTPPVPRPSGPLGDSGSTILYTDEAGKVTHEWRNGAWQELRDPT